ncbi:MAG: hypothetical protein OSB29_03325 [Verrucomicrobiota bacterium]|nr:hypothetical protein [Verrucomicrobiota bacterium]
MKQTIFFLGLVWGAMAWGAEHADRAKLAALAAKGDAGAQFELAYVLYWAKGMDRDLEASAKWASRAAKAGNVKAQFLHAVQLLLAHGVEGDSKAGFELLAQTHPKLEQAARAGDAQALYFSAQLYLFGLHPANGFGQDIETARQHERARQGMTAAAEKGNIKAASWLGQVILTKKVFLEGDTPKKAERWLRRAATAGNPFAAHALGNMHLKDDLGPADSHQAARWLKQAAVQGLAHSQQLYGSLLAGKSLGQSNHPEALKWIKRAANQGHGQAQFILAWFYLEGKVVEKNLEQASFWLTLMERQTSLNKAAFGLKQSLQAQLTPDQSLNVLRRVNDFKPISTPVTRNEFMGLLGCDLRIHRSTRMELFNWLAQNGNELAAYTLGEIKLKDANRHSSERQKLLKQAAALNNARAEELRVLAEEAGQVADNLYVEARKLFTMSAQKNNVKAEYALAIIYNNGLGTPISSAQAIEWFERAAKQNHKLAMWELVQLFEQGGTVKKDTARVLRILKQLADKGDMSAVHKLGIYYINGDGVEQDLAKAGACFLNASRQGYPPSQVSLGYFHLKGYGKNGVDHSEALKWMTLAARQGKMRAQIALGRMHHDGSGLKRDSEKGYEWLLIGEMTYALANPQKRNGLASEKQRLGEFKQTVAANLNKAQMQAAHARALKFKPVNLFRPGQAEPADAKALLIKANAGDPEAQFQLGQLHFKGIDGTTDRVQAYKWLTIAKNAGHALAGAERDSISQNMKNDQIIAAKRLARKFDPVNSKKD